MHFKLISLIRKVLELKNEDEIELIHWAVIDAIERQEPAWRKAWTKKQEEKERAEKRS